MPDPAVSRRTFLDTLLFTSLAATGLTVLAPIPFYLMPPPGARPRRVKAGNFSDIFKRSPFTTFEYGGRPATALLSDGVVRVISHRCTHQGCDVKLDPTKRQFECPCHGAIFASDGTPIRGPHKGPLASIPWRIIEGELEVGE